MSNLEEQNLMQSQIPMTKEDYNNIPVHYCKHCGSLRIMSLPNSLEDYCDECGSTFIGKASIEAWQELQKTKYKPIYRDKLEEAFNVFK